MKLSVDEFRNWQNKSITLLGMSGVGKTYISAMLRNSNWFHYSGDYRIGTRYLDEHILDEEVSILIPLLSDKMLELIKGPSREDESRTVRKG